MKSYHQWDEIKKHFGAGRLKQHGSAQHELNVFDMRMVDYYKEKFGLWLDFRSSDDNTLHGTGRHIENASEGITLAITKTAVLYLSIYGCNGAFVNIMY